MKCENCKEVEATVVSTDELIILCDDCKEFIKEYPDSAYHTDDHFKAISELSDRDRTEIMEKDVEPFNPILLDLEEELMHLNSVELSEIVKLVIKDKATRRRVENHLIIKFEKVIAEAWAKYHPVQAEVIQWRKEKLKLWEEAYPDSDEDFDVKYDSEIRVKSFHAKELFDRAVKLEERYGMEPTFKKVEEKIDDSSKTRAE